MKKFIWMECSKVKDILYESERDSTLPFLTQIKMDLHLLFCPRCAGELLRLRHLKQVMNTGFFPPSPGLEDVLMNRLYQEAAREEPIYAPAGFSFRLWVIIGFFVLLSLGSSFFGMNFNEVARAEGSSFLLPLGITVGLSLTCYGALFIGSHLKELSQRFRLR